MTIILMSAFPVHSQRSTGIIWEASITTQTPLGTAISDDGQRMLTAVGYEPATAALFDAWGNGSPEWIYGIDPHSIEADFSICTDGEVRVLVYSNLADMNSGVYKWSGDNREPDWHYRFSGNTFEGRGEVSTNGSRIVACASSASTVYTVVFDPASPDPLWESAQNVGIAGMQDVEVSGDGTIALASDLSGVWAFHVDSGTRLWEGMGAMAQNGYGISYDGMIIAAAVSAFPSRVEVREWNGSEYDLLWRFRMPGTMEDWMYDAIDVSDDGGTTVIGATSWMSRGHNWLGVFDTLDPDPLWSIEIEGGPSGGWFVWDVIEHIDLTSDGSRFIVGYWGDPEYPHEECFVFDRDDPDPRFVLDAPGSIFGADITADGTQAAVVCKCKHASQAGYGGSGYSIDLTTGVLLEVTDYPAEPVQGGDIISITVRIENTGSAAQEMDEIKLLASGPAKGEIDLFTGPSFFLDPVEIFEMEYNVTIPDIAPAGDYFVAAVVRLGGGWLAKDRFAVVIE